jgi:rare lipoprotein A
MTEMTRVLAIALWGTVASAAFAKEVPRSGPQHGVASWYDQRSGRSTASGERLDPNAMTAAHRTLPFGTKVRVTNLKNNRTTIVRINDRGPFIKGRVIDVTKAAGSELKMLASGTARVSLEVLAE